MEETVASTMPPLIENKGLVVRMIAERRMAWLPGEARKRLPDILLDRSRSDGIGCSREDARKTDR
jgi:hypothetical protein